MPAKKAMPLFLCAALLLLQGGCGESLPPPSAPGDMSTMTEEEIAEQAAFQKKMDDNIAKAAAKDKATKGKAARKP
ncbi:hypothetical protein [Paludisphaera mucosa]|uniref:Lipoprotein n=1 Tax=Paludisphaera mucosa TaxID=3030827 RepID=A0ABT6FA82_9BACT|nr:hypothetical protein [Paludisphaera mucosa]MDG3004503.1 hypothetical protein [Paludisphaera mucosa]